MMFWKAMVERQGIQESSKVAKKVASKELNGRPVLVSTYIDKAMSANILYTLDDRRAYHTFPKAWEYGTPPSRANANS